MPLTKQYLRYVPGDCFGVICSRKTRTLLLEKGRKGNKRLLAVSPALENVIVWDIKTGEKVSVLRGGKHEVTSLCKMNGTDTSAGDQLLAVGYDDGTVSIWDLESCDCRVTFSGHKTAVTCLHFDATNTRLVSGSNDTEIVVWDVIGENGLFRLKGHKGPITSCQFLTSHNVLITSSKDTVTKLWDLDTQHCFQTLVGHRSEVKGFVVLKEETQLVTASSDRELKAYKISPSVVEEGSVDVSSSVSMKEGPLQCKIFGTIKKASGKVQTIQVDQHRRHFVVMSGENTVEIYRKRTEEEMAKIMKKITKSMRKKSLKHDEELKVEPDVSHEIYLYHTFNNKNRMKSCDVFYRTETNEILLLLTLHNNSLELRTISSTDSTPSLSDSTSPPVYSIAHLGHRSDIRTVCISATGLLIASGSSDLVKIWKNGTCLHTLPCGYAVCSCFIPGDRYLLVGTKFGQICLFEISSGLLLDTFDAHSKAVWSVNVTPDRRGFVSGSADHDVKFWEFELTKDEKNEERKRLTATHIKTLKMSEDVLCVKYSPDQKLLAIALLDSTVKLFFADTLKFFLSLYGHKLPVLTMDISSDSTLLVTGSADKNIKIWGLDFGDCHRSIFAHDDSIMGVQFVPKTHLIFTVSKDKTLKYWDGDKYEHIQTLKGHQSEVWCLYISNDGNIVVTGSHDMSLRVWQCTQESLVLSEEKENERETEFEKAIAEGNDPVVPGERDDGEVGMAGKKTMETMQGAERIMEALEIYKEEIEKQTEHDEECLISGRKILLPDPHPILKALGNISPKKYVLSVVKKIKSSDLEKSLFVLPFSDAVEFMKICDQWLQEECEIELTCRCLFFLLRLHHHQITSSDILVHVMSSLQKHTMKSIDSVRDIYGFNLAGMRYLEQELRDHDMTVFKDLSVQVDAVRKRKRKKL